MAVSGWLSFYLYMICGVRILKYIVFKHTQRHNASCMYTYSQEPAGTDVRRIEKFRLADVRSFGVCRRKEVVPLVTSAENKIDNSNYTQVFLERFSNDISRFCLPCVLSVTWLCCIYNYRRAA